jgi:hypothetical protein
MASWVNSVPPALHGKDLEAAQELLDWSRDIEVHRMTFDKWKSKTWQHAGFTGSPVVGQITRGEV